MTRFRFKEADFTSPQLPDILRKSQWLVRRWKAPDTAAACRWGLVAGLALFWLIEPYDFIKRQLGWEEESKQ